MLSTKLRSTSMYIEDVSYRMRTVFFFLFVVGLLIVLSLHRAPPIDPWLVAAGTLVVYGVLFFLFDAMLWKLPIIRLLNSGIPNIAGDWEGIVNQTIGGMEQQITAKLIIRQTWSKLSLTLHTPNAIYRNTQAGLRVQNQEAIMLTFIYRESEHSHLESVANEGRGLIELTLHRTSPDGSMRGASFTGSFIRTDFSIPIRVEFKKPGPFYWNPEPF